ncbi:MAG: YbjN domain-containing protein [Alphaproteobacteria bacterium]|nr:YbjN domain-containing protein [Alphaproteobacteria bacterium]
MGRFVIALGLLLALPVTSALAQGAVEKSSPRAPTAGAMLERLTAEGIQALLRTQGLASRIGRDPTGDPMVTVDQVPGAAEMRVIFFQCAQTGCESATLWAYVRKRGSSLSVQTANEWNRDQRWTRAYIDKDGDAVLEMDLNADGGIGRRSMEQLVRTYLSQLRAFSRKFDQET